MTTQYISVDKSSLYEGSTNKKANMILIFGDEVETTGMPVNGRIPVTFRDHPGFIDEDHLSDHPALELYFIDIGTGDATFIVTPGRKKILIDGGLNRRALGFLAWKYHLDEAQVPLEIDLLVLSHADDDHINGLIPVLRHPKIKVGQVIQSGIATFQEGAFDTTLGNLDPSKAYLITLHQTLAELPDSKLSDKFRQWKNAITTLGATYTSVHASQGQLDIGDPAVTLEVLGPRLDQFNGQPAFRWFKDKPKTINGHSVVLRLVCGGVSTLFPGDLNIEGAKHLMIEQGLTDKMDAHIFKAPHHGSHEFHPPFLQAVNPQISVISSGDDRDHGHPRAIFLGCIGMFSRSSRPLVFSTEIAANFVKLEQEIKEDGPTVAAEQPVRNLKGDARQRALFKRRLHGMINVRTDGYNIYAARRVAAVYGWESYGPLRPAVRD